MPRQACSPVCSPVVHLVRHAAVAFQLLNRSASSSTCSSDEWAIAMHPVQFTKSVRSTLSWVMIGRGDTDSHSHMTVRPSTYGLADPNNSVFCWRTLAISWYLGQICFFVLPHVDLLGFRELGSHSFDLNRVRRTALSPIEGGSKAGTAGRAI